MDNTQHSADPVFERIEWIAAEQGGMAASQGELPAAPLRKLFVRIDGEGDSGNESSRSKRIGRS